MNQDSALENELIPSSDQLFCNINNELIVYNKNNKNIFWDDDDQDESLSQSDEFDLSKYDSSSESDRFRKKFIHKRKKQEDTIQPKKRPLNVLRKAGMIVLSREINSEICFMLLGDLFIHKGIFIDSRDSVMSNTCPVSIYRPVLSTERTDKYCLAYVENSSSGIVDLTFPIDLLNRLNCFKAKFVAEKMTQLLTFYASVNVLQTKVNNYYNNDKNKIEQLIAKNHLKSLEIAKNYLSRLTQEKIVMFHYKKIDPATLTHKLYYTGSNLTMSELFTGRSDFELMEQYLNRIGTPRYIDSAGMVNLTIAKFSGQTTFDLHLITLDDLVIPLNCSIKRIFLQEFEIIPGEKMSEYLDIHILDANLNIISDVLAKRNVPMSLSTVSQLEYEMKAEIFVQKFYEDEKTKKEL